MHILLTFKLHRYNFRCFISLITKLTFIAEKGSQKNAKTSKKFYHTLPELCGQGQYCLAKIGKRKSPLPSPRIWRPLVKVMSSHIHSANQAKISLPGTRGTNMPLSQL